MNLSLKKTGLLFLAAVTMLGVMYAAPAKKPNIIFILSDDMGYGDPKCYNPDSKIDTPSLDQLAKEGMRFTQAHAPHNYCVPSRLGLLTGSYPSRINFRVKTERLIKADQATLATVLKEAGYHTSMIGKWHLGFDGGMKKNRDYSQPLEGGPLDCGFDSYFGIYASLDIPPYFYIRGKKATAAPNLQIKASRSNDWTSIQGAFWRKGGVAKDFKHVEVMPKFVDKALDLIHLRSTDPDPFFLYLALPGPHTPWLPTAEFQGKSKVGMYGDYAMQVDHHVGQILNALKETGIDDDTLIFFSSDNGPVWYDQDRENYNHQATGPLRGIKSDYWEGAHRMPFLIRWPGEIRPGQVSDQLICFTDLYATLAELTGQSVPDSVKDSISFKHVIDGAKSSKARQSLLIGKSTLISNGWKYIRGNAMGGITGRMIKDRKGIPELKSDFEALYHLSEDIGESKNLLAKFPEKAQALEAQLDEILKEWD